MFEQFKHLRKEAILAHQELHHGGIQPQARCQCFQNARHTPNLQLIFHFQTLVFFNLHKSLREKHQRIHQNCMGSHVAQHQQIQLIIGEKLNYGCCFDDLLNVVGEGFLVTFRRGPFFFLFVA